MTVFVCIDGFKEEWIKETVIKKAAAPFTVPGPNAGNADKAPDALPSHRFEYIPGPLGEHCHRLPGYPDADGNANGLLFGQESDACKQGVPRCRDGADANNDGKVDIADAIKILGYLFTFATTGPLPEPFPDCGLDPETPADILDCVTYVPCQP